MASDPYRTLGIDPGASEVELRAAYRRAVQRHHPDHNGGLAEAARRFEEVQEAWTEIRRRREAGGPRGSTAGQGRSGPASDIDARLRAMEGELRAARAARDEAARQAREAAAAARDARDAARRADPDRPSDEELGYVSTDDSIGRILGDLRDELVGGLRERSAADRAADALEELAAKLRGEARRGS